MKPRIPDDRISSVESLAQNAIELTDEEVSKVGLIWADLQLRHSRKANIVSNLEELRDEALTRFAEIGIVATFDPTPCFYGEPPVVEFVGRTGGVVPFDHERKRHEVLGAIERNEAYRGQIERINVPRNKR